ncbi:MAG: hypothetical protein JJ863_19300 [Deltaproteobacteria bacterium]|nr:hypothetical protein [Deltaproteobacteria bacterium]
MLARTLALIGVALLVGCETQPAETTLLDQRTGEVSEDDLITASTRIGPPDAVIPIEVSFVTGRDGCATVEQLVVRRTGGTENLVLSNATTTQEDCHRSPNGNRGRPTLVKVDWSGFMGCKAVSASGDGFRLFPDGHIEAFMLQAQ